MAGFRLMPNGCWFRSIATAWNLPPVSTWKLEEFYCEAGPARETLLNNFGRRIQRNHPRRSGFKTPPLGWCSWYCFGPEVTVAAIERNLAWIATNAPQLRYIQIDDGYQPWMGDWLESGKSFGGDIKAVLRDIRRRGFEPALWLAPFVASPESKLFHDHPDWFVQDADGHPLRSDRVGFRAAGDLGRGMRSMARIRAREFLNIPCVHPAYGNGAAPISNSTRATGGRCNTDAFMIPRRRALSAYRRGMGSRIAWRWWRTFVLGCNHPVWPSLGLLDGGRSSMDISRSWRSIRDIGRQNLLRGWENGQFWWNDPDCVLLSPGRVMNTR